MVDRYRADSEMATGDVYDGRLFREEVFLPLVIDAGKQLGDGLSVVARPTPTASWPRPR